MRRGYIQKMHCLALAWLLVSTAQQAQCLKHKKPGGAATVAKGPGRNVLSASSARYQAPYNVCLFDWPPLVHCANLPPEEYDGYSVALWRLVAADLQWSNDDWFFTCMESEDALLEDLADPAGNCSINAAGLELNWDNTKSDEFKFSWPVYKSGFSVMVSNPAHSSDLWVFAVPYHWTVWVLFGGSIFIVALLVTLAEVLTFGSKANRQGLQGWLWYVLGKQLHFTGQVGAPKTWASRVLVLGYGLLAMISLHLYTATLASKIISEQWEGQINSKDDLVGRRVGAFLDDVPLFRKYSIKADPFPWEDRDHVADMLDMLRDQQFEALILDTPAVSYYTSTARGCDLYPAGEPFDTFYVAIGFPKDAPDDITLNVSASIVRLQTLQGELDRLENEHILGGTGGCTYTAGQAHGRTSYQISLSQVRGLWLILGCVGGLCVAWAGIQALRHRECGQKNSKPSNNKRKEPQHIDIPEPTVDSTPGQKDPVIPAGAVAAPAVLNKSVDGAATFDKMEFVSGDGSEIQPHYDSPAAMLARGDVDAALSLNVKPRNTTLRNPVEMEPETEPEAGMQPVTLFNAITSQPGSG